MLATTAEEVKHLKELKKRGETNGVKRLRIIEKKELLELEYVLLESGRNGALCRYRLAYEGQGKDGSRFMLGLTNPASLACPESGRGELSRKEELS